MTSTLTIDGITYEVVTETTPESAKAQGWHNLAANMRQNGNTRQFGLRRPKGHTSYFVNEFNGTFGPVVSLGR